MGRKFGRIEVKGDRTMCQLEINQRLDEIEVELEQAFREPTPEYGVTVIQKLIKERATLTLRKPEDVRTQTE